MTNQFSAPALAPLRRLSANPWWQEFMALLRLGWPLMIAQLAQTALMTTDVLMMGRLGPKYLAAGALAIPYFMSFQLLGIGIVSAVAPMVAQSLGARDFRSVRRTVRQGLWISILLATAMLPLVWNVRPALALLGQSPELAELAETFLHFAVWLLFPAFMIIVMRSFLSAHGSTTIILVTTLAGVVFNALSNYALVFGNWGFPRLGIAGSGISTTLVNLLMLLLLLGYVLRHRRYRRYHILARFTKPDWRRFAEIWRIGTPIGLMLLAEVGLFSLAAFLQGWLGADEVAAHAIALQFASISFMVPLGLSQATTVRIGIALGEGNKAGIGRAGWTSLGATALFMVATSALFLAFPHSLVALFLDPADPQNLHTLNLASGFLIIAAMFQVVDGVQVSAGSALRGLSDTTAPLVIALFGYWAVGFPTSWLFGFVFNMRGTGIWLGLAAGLAVAAIALTIRFAMRERLGLTTPKPV